jgi:hypothetical protein
MYVRRWIRRNCETVKDAGSAQERLGYTCGYSPGVVKRRVFLAMASLLRARSSAAPPWKKSEKRLGRRLRRFDQTLSGASMSSSLVSVAAYLVKIDKGSRKGRRKEDHLQEMEFETPIGKVS